jgi:hypothetical protein
MSITRCLEQREGFLRPSLRSLESAEIHVDDGPDGKRFSPSTRIPTCLEQRQVRKSATALIAFGAGSQRCHAGQDERAAWPAALTSELR